MARSLLALQPIVCGMSHTHRAYETLARFSSPRGLLGPYESLRDEEWAPLDLEILTHLRDWARVSNQRLSPLFINISAKTLSSDDKFEAWIDAFQRLQSGVYIPVTIEVSEFVNDDHLELRWKKLFELSGGVALDDFGDCFASMERLKEYPWSICKIEYDKVRLRSSKEAMAYCRQQGIELVIEKISSPVESARARGLGLHQGYFYGRPQTIAMDFNILKPEMI